MLEDANRFAVVRDLRTLFETARREVASLAEAEWLTWPAANAQCVRVFPLQMKYRPPWIDDRFAERRARLPETWARLAALPQMVTAVVSTLAPGGRILPHRDLEEPDLLRCHLPLAVPAGERAWFRVGETTFSWRAGECVAFHACQDHEGGNDGDSARVLLIVDFDVGAGIVSGRAS